VAALRSPPTTIKRCDGQAAGQLRASVGLFFTLVWGAATILNVLPLDIPWIVEWELLWNDVRAGSV